LPAQIGEYLLSYLPNIALDVKSSSASSLNNTALFYGKIEKWEMDKSPEPLYFFPPFFFFPLAALATILTSKL
jgi:hypothetical protein